MKKRFLSLALALIFVLAAVPVTAHAATYETVEQTIRAMGIITGDNHGSLNLENAVTRAEFAKMMVSASIYKDSIGEGSSVSPFSDVKYSHWAAEYIRVAVTAGWFVGYVDGSFHPGDSITLEEAATALLRLLGYTQADLIGVYPTAQLTKFRALDLDEGLTLERGDIVTRQDCLYLFYNLMSAASKTGMPYGASLGYTVNLNGELDYAALVAMGTKGPYVIYDEGWTKDLPFSLSTAEIHRNGSAAEAGDAAIHDVYYYHANLRTLWLYGNAVTGLYTAAVPSAASPTSILLGGVTYAVGTSNAAYKLSSSGSYAVGDTITLLLGRSGEVVEVLAGEAGHGRYYGRVTAIETTPYDTATGKQDREVLSLFCTDAMTRQFAYDGEAKLKTGDLAQVNIQDGETEIIPLPAASVTGTINRDGTRLDQLTLADDIEIMEVTDAAAVPLPLERLYGAKLERRHVAFYAQDSAGAVTHLILRDVTGDYNTYGIITNVSDTEITVGDVWFNAVSIDIMVGPTATSVIRTNNLRFVPTGPAKLELADNTLGDVTTLSEVALTALSGDKATATNRQFTVSRTCQVYLVERGQYTLTDLSTVSDLEKYALKGYHDTGYPAGNQLRIILAEKK